MTALRNGSSPTDDLPAEYQKVYDSVAANSGEGAAHLPDDVAGMIESLRCAMATDVEQLKAANMLERLVTINYQADLRCTCDEHGACAWCWGGKK